MTTQKLTTKLRKQEKLLRVYKRRERWMEWAVGLAIILILLLFLLVGYATDWSRGIKKGTSFSSSPLNSSAPGSQTESQTTQHNTSTGSKNTSQTNRTLETKSSISDEKNTTTNTTPGNTLVPPETNDNLADLYASVSIGDTIDDTLNLANTLGISVTCKELLLIRECSFSEGSASVTTRNILGTGIVTSVKTNL